MFSTRLFPLKQSFLVLLQNYLSGEPSTTFFSPEYCSWCHETYVVENITTWCSSPGNSMNKVTGEECSKSEPPRLPHSSGPWCFFVTSPYSDGRLCCSTCILKVQAMCLEGVSVAWWCWEAMAIALTAPPWEAAGKCCRFLCCAAVSFQSLPQLYSGF